MRPRHYRPVRPENIDPGFGHWLAGFIDGEGCFVLNPPPPSGFRWHCVFRLSVRDDDAAIIKEIAKRTGFGAVARRDHGATHKCSQISWTVSGKQSCVALVALLETYPLRAKKSRDFVIWRTAVNWWAHQRPKGSGHPRNRPHYDWSIMEQLHRELTNTRKYRPETPQPPLDPQLQLRQA